MSRLLVGFDSAWTPNNYGAIVGTLQFENGTFQDLGEPQILDYHGVESTLLGWQAKRAPSATIVMLDQPTIVKNAGGQRPVENIVGSSISIRHGGMQPANTSRAEMFGEKAPVWGFLNRFGGPANSCAPIVDTRVFETYPALALIALGWTLQDSRSAGRLPKYNPARGKTFSISDWQYVCGRLSGEFFGRGLEKIVAWIDDAARKTSPRKFDQDRLDACLCLLVALHLAEQKDCLMVGDLQTGYIVVPHSRGLCTHQRSAECSRVAVSVACPSSCRGLACPYREFDA